MKLKHRENLGKAELPEQVQEDIATAVTAVKWPPASDDCTIYAKKDGNGVVHLKKPFLDYLELKGWKIEPRKTAGHNYDAIITTGDGACIALEWETGNVASSHRSINRLLLGILQQEIIGGVLVVSSKALGYYLTDRIGTFEELRPYLPLWSLVLSLVPVATIAIVVVEHDAVSEDKAFIIPKQRKGKKTVE